MSLEDLQARLASLKSTSAVMSKDDADEATVRDQIATEEDRLATERAKKRTLENARLLDAAKRKRPDAILELKDLDEAGVYIMTAPPQHAADKYRDAVADNGGTSSKAIDDLVISSMVYPDPEASGVETRSMFDKFTFASAALLNVCIRLGGLKIEARRKK